MNKFWCCFVEEIETGGFSYKHATEEDARIEAERLAKLPCNEGRNVYVLQAIAFCQTEYPPVRFYDME